MPKLLYCILCFLSGHLAFAQTDTCLVVNNTTHHLIKTYCGTMVNHQWQGVVNEYVRTYYTEPPNYDTTGYLLCRRTFKNGMQDGVYYCYNQGDKNLFERGKYKEGKHLEQWHFNLNGAIDSMLHEVQSGIINEYQGGNLIARYIRENVGDKYTVRIYYPNREAVKEVRHYKKYLLDADGWHVPQIGLVRYRARGTWEYYNEEGQLIEKKKGQGSDYTERTMAIF